MKRNDYKAAMKQWLNLKPADRCLAVTLTMKQSSNFQALDSTAASQNLKHFLNKLNRHCFGNAFKRYNKRLEVMPILEKSNWQRLHYHLLIRLPDGVDEATISELIPLFWMETRFGYSENRVETVYSYYWIDYIMKKLAATSELDIENTYIISRT